MEKTKGFVIKTIKYGDSSVILKVYTAAFGIRTFLQKGYFNPNKRQLRSLQFPFAMAEFSFKQNKKSDLILPTQIIPVHSYSNIFMHPIKIMMLQFLAEISYLAIKEEEDNPKLFDFIEKHLHLFNEKTNQFADFHLIFLLRLTEFLGISPNISNRYHPYFDIQEGSFIPDTNATFLLNEYETSLWKRLLTSTFHAESKNQFNQIERNILTDIMINYYKLHVPGFREPNSLEIIKEVFNS
ncbi:DNA repair protein RecO [Flavobacteriaceae bacterium Ap0902]|nr:DNA repair protein RecO [Flavobacteriaceae bacterium Ap0902]